MNVYDIKLRRGALLPFLEVCSICSASAALFLVGSGGSESENVPVYRWSKVDAKLTPLGEVPLYETLGVGDDGTLWAIRPAYPPPGSQQSVYFLREVPGGGRVQSWRIDGQVLGGGPGYVVYVPKSDSASLDIFFPLQHRTVHYRKAERSREDTSTRGPVAGRCQDAGGGHRRGREGGGDPDLPVGGAVMGEALLQ